MLKKELEQELKKQVKANTLLAEELEKVKRQYNEELKDLSRSLEEFERRIINRIDRVSKNALKQIESYIGLQNYLNDKTLPPDFHGWPLSPDIALFLVQKIEMNHYDLIIEFGSGTSTVMMAKAIKMNADHHEMKLVTFEHHQKFYDLTSRSLTGQSLEKYVDLTYAPLKEFAYGDEKYIYYSCGNKMAELAKAGEYSKILVLVDGPPGSTCPLARFPALPYLLEFFPAQAIDLVLDDFGRKEEKKIVEKWEELLREKEIAFESESVPAEKGLYFCQIKLNLNRWS